MKNSRRMTLQTKILWLISTLVLFVIIMLAGIFSYLQAIQTERQVEQLALQAARSIALMPEIMAAMETDNAAAQIEPIAVKVREQINAADIMIESRSGIEYSYSSPELIGVKNTDQTRLRALIFGGSYTFEDSNSAEPALKGIVPITANYGEYNKIIGTVTVKFLKADIYQGLYKRIKTILLFSLIVLIMGITGGILLARSIRKDTLGLEPHEISSLFRERNAILLSIREGILAFDGHGLLTLINHSAKEMLYLNDANLGRPIEELITDESIIEVIKTGKQITNTEIPLNEKIFIFNIIPIIEDGKRIGVVASFRDKTELKKLMDTVSEVRDYSEGLRAQTHEFTNKLYLLSGLLQLGRHQEAYEFIQKESKVHQSQNHILFSQIRDPNVQAILLGKLGKASEKKVQLEIDPNSSTNPLPKHIELSHLVTIIGNLLDNAFDAVKEQQTKLVVFHITDLGNDIIIEVTDTGEGIEDSLIDSLFTKGFSSKGMNRGYGLFNVKEMTNILGGTIEISRNDDGGAIFTVYLPKKMNKKDQEV